MNRVLKNHTNQEILTELEKRLATNSLTRKDMTTLSSIIAEHLYLFYRTFQPPEKVKKTKIQDQPLSEEEQKKVDQF
jgi:hypothetical protein